MATLSADRPCQDPNDDLFGHAPFAKNLAESICRFPGADGLVLALYGPWGSGKSTVLSFLQHYLAQCPQDRLPVVVKFNPWWFSGQDNLAQAFLGQLQAVLPSHGEAFKKLGDLLADFAEGVGGLIDLSGVTGGFGAGLGRLLKKAKRKPKDVPALKEAISSALLKAGKRIVVIVDDIDRLTPDETRQLFTVVKALADFPNVVYLLAFDREVAIQAIESQTGLPGERFLEKIIQVPFDLPPVDRTALRNALFKRLDEILVDTPEKLFDGAYWTNLYYHGIDPLIQVPRDMVRLTNTLLVTYPSVRGEVNPAEFIALEALRVFLPNLYSVIRNNPDRFAGHTHEGPYGDDRDANRAFHQKWLEAIPEHLQKSTQKLMERIFPKTGTMGYGPDWLANWRRELRACHPDIFPVYFRLSLPVGAISRSEMEDLLALTGSPDDFGNALLQAKEIKRPDGLSKASALLERLMDYVEKDIPYEHISLTIQVLLDVGDRLAEPADEYGMFSIGGGKRIVRFVYWMMKRLKPECRANTVVDAIRSGESIYVQCKLVRILEDEVEKQKDSVEAPMLTSDSVARLTEAWVERVRLHSKASEFVSREDLPTLLYSWRQWASEEEVRTWSGEATRSEVSLLDFVTSFMSYSRSQVAGDYAVRRHPRLNPKSLEPYIDIATCADRLRQLQGSGNVPEKARDAVGQFLKEYDMILSGKDPEGVGVFDD